MRAILRFAIVCLLAVPACSSSPQKASPPKTGWVSYEDLAEHAFSFEAPQSWEVKGGAYRFGYFDVRPMIDVRSPDTKIIIRVFDANIPAYVPPGPHVGAEGQAFNKPGQFQTVVQRYRDAKSFAETYANSRFKSVCQNMSAQSSNWQPSLPVDPEDPSPAQQTSASMAYSCSTSAGPHVAVVYAHTALFRGAYDSSFWVASTVSAIATPENVNAAEAIAQHILSSFHKNPQWVAYQKQMEQAGIANIQRNFQVFMGQMQQYHNARSAAWNNQVSGFEARQQASAAQSSQWGDILTGLTDARDPATGQNFKVWTGQYSNYYINGLGNKVNANTSPGPDYRQLDTSPR